jgi:hypothetical protein
VSVPDLPCCRSGTNTGLIGWPHPLLMRVFDRLGLSLQSECQERCGSGFEVSVMHQCARESNLAGVESKSGKHEDVFRRSADHRLALSIFTCETKVLACPDLHVCVFLQTSEDYRAIAWVQ